MDIPPPPPAEEFVPVPIIELSGPDRSKLIKGKIVKRKFIISVSLHYGPYFFTNIKKNYDIESLLFDNEKIYEIYLQAMHKIYQDKNLQGTKFYCQCEGYSEFDPKTKERVNFVVTNGTFFYK
jgi:topoisomerase IA-like protein